VTRPLVSLVLVTFNSEAVLPPLLDSLALTEYSPYELIVVDNGSTDGTLAVIEDRLPDATVFRNSPSRGYGSGCNQGAAAAHGDYLVFLNPDIVVRPDWLSVLVECFERDPELGVASPEVLPPGWRPRDTPERSVEVSTVPGCSMMVSRAAWTELGGFDERIFLYWEDTDLCWRAWLRGWRVLETLGTHVFHDEGSGGGGSRSLAGEEMRNALYVTLKLRRGRRVPLVLAGRAGSTLAKALLWRRVDVFSAWRWNAVHLRSTLALRRELLHGLDDERVAALERRIAGQTRRRIRERLLARVRPRLAA
jgi:GT2 family glycosyltransferase